MAALGLAACHGAEPEAANTPSGQPVPRYVTLKVAPVNARGGPGEDYKALWTYQVRGVPLQVVEETADWRRVCDPDGGLAWIHKRTVDARRTVMRLEAHDLPLLRAPSDDAKPAAVLAGRSVAELATCKAGWCRLTASHASGWARAGSVWGTSDKAQCRQGGQ